MSDTLPVPDGFTPHTRKSPLTEPWEPIYAMVTADAHILGIHVRAAHTNSRGLVHGGLISALADNAMGLSCGLRLREGQRLLTVSLSIDFLGQAKLGQWLTVETNFVKPGGTLCVAQSFIKADGAIIARANASFRVVEPARAA